MDEAVGFARRLVKSGLTRKELEKVLMVTQSTVSRLLHARILDVRRHVAAFDRRPVVSGEDADLEEALVGLAVGARRDPVLRRIVIDLHELMHNA